MKKNVLSIVTALAIVCLGAWLFGLSFDSWIEVLTLALPVTVLALAIEDFWRKQQTSKQLMTWQYFVGLAIIGAGIIFWFFAESAQTIFKMIVWLIVMVLTAAIGFIWFKYIYKASLMGDFQKEQLKWKHVRRKFKNASSTDGLTILAATLRYKTIDDKPLADLDEERPLIEYLGELWTLDELNDSAQAGDEIDHLGSEARAYLEFLSTAPKEGV